jgi:hypothetical protein
MAAADIIFNIGTVGADGAVSAIGSVTAALVEMGSVIFDEVKEAERFAQVVKRLETDMSSFDKETKGLIDTFDSFTAANTASRAGMQLSAKEINTLGKAYIDSQRKIGESTDNFTGFVEQLAKGSSRSLKKLGGDMEDLVEDSATLAQRQRAGVDFIMAGYSELDIQLETTAERAFALENAVGTLRAQLVGAAFEGFKDWAGDSFDTLGALTEQVDKLSSAMFKTNGLMGEWITSAEGAQFAFSFLGNTIGAALTPFEKFDNNLKVLNQQLDETTVKLMAVSRAGTVFKRVFAENLAEQGAMDALLKKNKQDLAQIELLEAQFDRDDKPTKGKKKKTFEEIVFEDRSVQTAGERAAGAAPGELFVDVSDVQDPAVQASQERIAAEIFAAQNKAQVLAEIEAQTTEDMALEQEARKDMAIQSMGLVGNAAKQWAGVVDTSSRKGFNANKALRLSEVAITTPIAALNSFNQGMAMGGPIPAGILMASAIALGIATAANIAKQKYKGGSKPSRLSISKPSTGAAFAGGPTSGAGQTTNINNQIVVDGQVIHESLMRIVDSKNQQGQETLVKSTAA